MALCWKRGYRQWGPIGLDIGHDSIKMIQLAIGAKGLMVAAAQRRPMPAPQDGLVRQSAWVPLIVNMLEEGCFHGRDVVVCLPNDQLKITSLRAKDDATGHRDEALVKQTAHHFGLDPDEDPIHCIPVGRIHQGDQTKQEMIWLGTDTITVNEFIRTLEKAGVIPIGLEPLPCALFRCFERTMRRQEDRLCSMIIMDVGYQSTTIVFGRGDQIRFIKQIPLGTVHFDQALAAKLKIDPREAAQLRQRLNARSQRPSPQKEPAGDTEKMPTDPMDSGISEMTQPAPSVHRMIFYVIRNVAQTLAREVSLCMRYYSVTFRGHPIDRLMLCGGGAYEKIFRDVLTTQTGLDVQLAEPLCSVDGSGVPYAPLPFNQGCEWAVALGLGLKGWEWAYTNTLQRSRSCRLVPTS